MRDSTTKAARRPYMTTCTALGLQHGLERTGHTDMIEHMRTHFSAREQAAYGRGILFGWFWRVIAMGA